MKIITDGYEVYESGNLFCPDVKDTTFIISEDPKMVLTFKIRTTEDKEKGIELEHINESTVAFVFSNPSGLGYGNAKPVKLGHLNGKEFYASFHVDMKGKNESYTLHYTFLLKEANNG